MNTMNPMPNKPDRSIRERIIKIIGLERNLKDQLVPANLDDFFSDWSLTVDALLALYAEMCQTVIGEDNHTLLEANGIDYTVSHRNELRAEQRKYLHDQLSVAMREEK